MYELMLVAMPGKGESLLSRVEKSIKDADGSEFKVDKLGKRPLAYSIKKNSEADFSVLRFEVPAEGVKPITDKLRLEQDDLLRYLLIKVKLRKPSGRKVKAEVKEEPKREVKKQAPKVTVVTKTSEKKVSSVSRGTKVSKVKAKAKKK